MNVWVTDSMEMGWLVMRFGFSGPKLPGPRDPCPCGGRLTYGACHLGQARNPETYRFMVRGHRRRERQARALRRRGIGAELAEPKGLLARLLRIFH